MQQRYGIQFATSSLSPVLSIEAQSNCNYRHYASTSIFNHLLQEENAMKNAFQKSTTLLALLLTGMLASGSVYADKPDWAGGKGKHEQKSDGKRDNNKRGDDHHDRDGRNERNDRRDHTEIRINAYFNDHQREYAHAYYGGQFRSGRCPPGLAKKHNGCMPPGQAKKWRRGYPLPRDVIFYDVPNSVVVELGYPPAGHRYVRVAADILMIAVGTGMVVDAIEDLNRM
jgi:Ni/Co efflux regulator RcnB